jgi:hypothetical protein
MKTILAVAAATSLALVAVSPFALAEGPRPSSGNAIARSAGGEPAIEQSAPPHYEWQYHYVGRHARLQGYWALVR